VGGEHTCTDEKKKEKKCGFSFSFFFPNLDNFTFTLCHPRNEILGSNSPSFETFYLLASPPSALDGPSLAFEHHHKSPELPHSKLFWKQGFGTQLARNIRFFPSPSS